MRRILIIFCLLAAGQIVRAQYPGYTPIADLSKFKEQFAAAAQKTNSIKSDFTQQKNLSMLSEKIVSKGKFWFRKNSLVRMEYVQPYKYLVIINKDDIFVKDDQKENKISTKSNGLFKQINKITVECVQGTILNDPDFKTRVFEDKTNYLVEFTPVDKQLKDLFKNINIMIDKKDESVSGIDMKEPSGDNTLIQFTNKEINAAIPDALFAIK